MRWMSGWSTLGKRKDRAGRWMLAYAYVDVDMLVWTGDMQPLGNAGEAALWTWIEQGKVTG
jgi:hypothetical protein